MKGKLPLILLSSVMLGIFPAAWAGAVIANNSVDIKSAEVKDTFLGDKVLSGSIKLVIVDNAAELGNFTQAALGMDATHYQSRWQKKSFREGVPPPQLKANDAEVAAFVKATPGGVGYVKSAPSGVKVISNY